MEITWKRGSQISDEIINEVQVFFNVILPEDLKNVVKNFNNGRPSLSTFDSQVSKEHVFKKLLSFKKDDLETVYTAKKVLENIEADIFPFANDPAGNLICLKDGKVVLWFHEDDSIILIANSFTEFLDKLY